MDVSYELNQKHVGKKYKVLVDRMENGEFIGRTCYDSPEVDNEVIIQMKDGYLRIGDFVDCKIIEAEAYDLFAEPI